MGIIQKIDNVVSALIFSMCVMVALMFKHNMHLGCAYFLWEVVFVGRLGRKEGAQRSALCSEPIPAIQSQFYLMYMRRGLRLSFAPD